MTNGNSMAPVEAPSKEQLLKATGVAILVAIIIFFTVVLPAEYGKDPLHTGAALGLMNLSKSPAIVEIKEDVKTAAPTIEPGADGEAPVIKDTFVAQSSGYKTDSRELKLGPGEGMEIKYHMARGAGMIYSWKANSVVSYEFHGEPDLKPKGASEDYYESYEKDEDGKKESHGTFTAPSTGIQGWFWENDSGAPVTIKLVTAGFYDYILQNKDDVKTRLQPLEPK
jgi:hypothetical protein